MNRESYRINWIDWAKTFGIFFVVLGHVYFPPDVMFLKKLIYGFHMPFFFIISGFLFKEDSDCIKKNLQRLIIPYFAFNILFLVGSYIFHFRNGINSVNNDYFLNVFFNILKGNGIDYLPYWFLLALFWAKVFTYYLLRLRFILMIIITVAMGILGYFMTKTAFVDFYCLSLGLIATPFVIIGFFSKKYNLIEIIFRQKIVLMIYCILSFIIYILLVYKLQRFDFLKGFLTNKPIFGVVMSLIGSSVFILLCRFLNSYSNRFIKKISNGTLVILMIHPPIYQILLNLYSSQPRFIISILFSCSILIFSYLIIYLIEKNSILSFLFLGKTLKKRLILK